MDLRPTQRTYHEETMWVLWLAEDLMDAGVTVTEAFSLAHGEIEREELRND